MEQKLLSLCIPTNGVSEWVFPVLDSIFSQNIDERLYEVIVTDNGENKDFQNKVQEYKLLHSNFIYQQTSAFQFLNQVEAFRLANGLFIKFVNHRTVMKPGTIKYLLDLVEQNKKEKPVIFFLNGKKNINNNMEIYPDFNQFIKGLSYWSSWSGGIACWKEDFEKIPSDIMYNELFPHTTILFYERKKSRYVIDKTILFEELPVANNAKGRYNVFYAFAVEYICIICDLLRAGDITKETFLLIKKDNFELVSNLYLDYILMHKKCSYDLAGYKKLFEIFYSYRSVKIKAWKQLNKRIVKKFLNMI